MRRGCVEHMPRASRMGLRAPRCTAEEERTYSPLRLLTLATLHLPDLALYAYLLDVMDEDDEVDRVRAVLVRGGGRDGRGGAATRASRAGDARAQRRLRDGAWLERVLDYASASLWRQADAQAPVLLEHARGAAVALTPRPRRPRMTGCKCPRSSRTGSLHLLVVYLIAARSHDRARRAARLTARQSLPGAG